MVPLQPFIDRIVRFNVGGEPHDILLSTLAAANAPPGERDGSWEGVGDNALYRLALTDAESAASARALGVGLELTCQPVAATDDAGRIFLDRDPAVFRAIVSLLRGYPPRASAPASVLPALRADCAALGLLPMFLRAFPDPPPARFVGGGAGPDGRTLSCNTIVSLATGFHTKGVITVAFQVESIGEGARASPPIGVGVVSRAVTAFDREFHTQPGTACYYSNGALQSFLSGVRRAEDTNAPYGTPDAVVAVTLDFEQMKVAFKRVPGVQRQDRSCASREDPTVWIPRELVRSAQVNRLVAIGNAGDTTDCVPGDGALAIAAVVGNGAKLSIFYPFDDESALLAVSTTEAAP